MCSITAAQNATGIALSGLRGLSVGPNLLATFDEIDDIDVKQICYNAATGTSVHV